MLRLEEYAEASNNLQAALAIFAEVQSRNDEAETLNNLAELHQKTGELDRALDYCDRALALAIELGILVEQLAKSARLEAAIRENIGRLGR